MGMGGGPGQMGFDAAAAYKNEREALGITKHEWLGDKAEKQLLGARYPEDAVAAVDLSKYVIYFYLCVIMCYSLIIKYFFKIRLYIFILI